MAVAAVVVLVGAGVTWLVVPSSSSVTHTAEECRKPGGTDEQGFTDCLRQLAGEVPENGQCAPGTGTGPAAAANEEELGVTVTCSAPGRAGTQITYLHGSSRDTLELYTDGLLTRNGATDRIEADWRGNALDGHYAASAGRSSSVLVFTVKDRPLSGFVYQVGSAGGDDPAAPSELADYFEGTVQPGE